MKQSSNVSAQDISWVKSNKRVLEPIKGISNLYYPESIGELENLVRKLEAEHSPYMLLGWSSNTLFLPSFRMENVVCTRYLKGWTETATHIVCECGVNVSALSKEMVRKGYVGFEGLTDLPGTVAAAVYGNCGCRGCSVNALVDYFTMLLPSGKTERLTPEDLRLKYRSTSLKRGETRGVILQVYLKINRGDAGELMKKAEANHQVRLKMQPSPANNLGTTFVLGQPNLFGKVCSRLNRWLRHLAGNDVASYARLLKMLGKGRFAPYTYRAERYMFLDERAHELFPQYVDFVKRMFPDAHLEIEIRK